ncbi:hypothetical protein WJX77_010801 [Trebouxia sp. C0004]
MSSYSSISQQTAVKCRQSFLLSLRPRLYHLQHRSICCQGKGPSEPKPAKGKASKQKSAKPRRSSKQKAPNQKPAPAPTPASAVEADVIDVEGSVVDMRIPVTVITGFLGSGKTTLLNNILTKSHGKRIAVIENEFGEIDIDSDLVISRDTLPDSGEQIMMLNNGCMCCTVRDDLVNMLNDLIRRRDQFDQVVIETTGLANPAPIINTLLVHDDMQDNIRLDGVVTLVDAKHVEQHLDDKQKSSGAVNEAVEQIAYADRILLNKVDLVSPADLQRLEKRIKSINGMAQIKHAERADVPVEYVLGIGGFDLDRVDTEVDTDEHQHSHAASESQSHEEHSHSHHSHSEHSESQRHSEHSSSDSHPSDSDSGHSEAHSHSHDHHQHDHGLDHVHDDSVSSVSIMLDGSLDFEKVNAFLGCLLQMNAENLYRYKGLLAVDGEDNRLVFQGVHMMFESIPDRPWKADEKRYSKMVFIGRDLDKDLIREGFLECLAV